MLLQKSKIERRQKSRESQCVDVSIAAGCDGAITKVPGRFLRNDMVLHVAKRGKHQRLLKFSFITAKRLLQAAHRGFRCPGSAMRPVISFDCATEYVSRQHFLGDL